MTSPTTYPILAVPHPLVLFPNAALTFPVSQQPTAAALLALLKRTDDPLVAAVPTKDDGQLAECGVAARIVRLVKPPSTSRHLVVTLQGVHRIRLLTKLILSDPLPVYEVSQLTLTDRPPTTKQSIAGFKSTALRFLDVLAKDPASVPSKRAVYIKLSTLLDSPTATDDKVPIIADLLVASLDDADFNERLEILSTPTPSPTHLALVTALLNKQTSISQVSQKVSSSVHESLSIQQKQFFLRQQVAAIQRELVALQKQANNNNNNIPSISLPNPNAEDLDAPNGELDSDPFADEAGAGDTSLSAIKQSILLMRPSSEERVAAIREWKRLKRIPRGSVESGVIRTYLEWITSLPWPQAPPSPDNQTETQTQTQTAPRQQPNLQLFLSNSLAKLNADHYGLHEVKKRIIEYLAVVKLRELRSSDATAATKTTTRTKGPILLFLGPPGTGKTSLGHSISQALDLPFQRISLGGVRDEAEIRGHRRTYVASGPGRVVRALCKMWRDVKEGKVGEGSSAGEWKGGVLLLDEVDKIAQSNHQGDPSAALLEVLDPEQNHSFTDHYVSLPISLSSVLFICTANTLASPSLPPALIDRCEVIQLQGYTPTEKIEIASRFLLPKLLRENGMRNHDDDDGSEKVVMKREAVKALVDGYAFTGNSGNEHDGGGGLSGGEGGVRGLEKALGRVVRAKVVEYARSLGGGGCSEEEEPPDTTGKKKETMVMMKKYNPVVEIGDLERYLGLPRHKWEDLVGLDFDDDDDEDGDREHDLEVRLGGGKLNSKGKRGVVFGLVVSGIGEGGVMPVESVFVPAGATTNSDGTAAGRGGGVRLTGMLGDVLKESAELALTWVKAHAYDLGITSRRGDDPFASNMDVHIHLPSGAQRKDGPSAGIAMVCALVSLLTGHAVPPTTALTGEITLRGAVAPVGGIKAKLLGAKRVGLKKVILPFGNRREVDGPPQSGGNDEDDKVVMEDLRKGLECVFVRSIREAVDEAFGRGALVWRGRRKCGPSGGDEKGVMMGMGSACVRVPTVDESRL